MPEPFDRSDWVLLATAASPERGLSPVQLQKIVFLLDRNLSEADLQSAARYAFRAYDYGPFDRDVYLDAEELETAGFLKIVQPPATRYRKYRVTDQGLERAAALRRRLKPDVRKYLDAVVTWASSLSFDSLVRAVYKQYPEMKANSVFKG